MRRACTAPPALNVRAARQMFKRTARGATSKGRVTTVQPRRWTAEASKHLSEPSSQSSAEESGRGTAKCGRTALRTVPVAVVTLPVTTTGASGHLRLGSGKETQEEASAEATRTGTARSDVAPLPINR